MRVTIYEYITANGIGRNPESELHSLWVEGTAMRDAILADMAEIAEVYSHEDGDFESLVRNSDYTLIIAPESEGILERLTRQVLAFDGKLLGPGPESIAIAADKYNTYHHWRNAEVRTPETILASNVDLADFHLPWIVKPRDGAGSTNTLVLRSRDQLPPKYQTSDYILQPYLAGQPASVAFLCGECGHQALLACTQSISTDGDCKYLGGVAPLTPELNDRAVTIGRQALAAIPVEWEGYVGVDLILGQNPNEDVTLEINPRLTTSYVGLRKLCQTNLAEAMLRMIRSEFQSTLSWQSGSVQWYPDGCIHLSLDGG